MPRRPNTKMCNDPQVYIDTGLSGFYMTNYANCIDPQYHTTF